MSSARSLAAELGLDMSEYEEGRVLYDLAMRDGEFDEYAWTGDADSAFEWLELSAEQNEAGLLSQFDRPWYAPIHDDPRWAAFLERTGTSPEQLAAIEFDVRLPQ